jgi:hypothetical protein
MIANRNDASLKNADARTKKRERTTNIREIPTTQRQEAAPSPSKKQKMFKKPSYT